MRRSTAQLFQFMARQSSCLNKKPSNILNNYMMNNNLLITRVVVQQQQHFATHNSKLFASDNSEINDMEIKSWEIIRNKVPSHLPKGSSKYLKELDRLIYQYVSKTRRGSTKNTIHDVTLINSLAKLSETLKKGEEKNNLGVYLELINISCYFGYLPFALHLVNSVHSQFKFTLDYKTYRDIVNCFIENEKFDECFNFIVDLEDKHGLRPNYQLYLPLYLSMKEILSENDKKAQNYMISTAILNQMIPRLSEDQKLLNDVLSRDKFTTGLLGRNVASHEDDPRSGLGYYQEYDQLGDHHHHYHCGDESCAAPHSELNWWEPNERDLLTFKNEWEHKH